MRQKTKKANKFALKVILTLIERKTNFIIIRQLKNGKNSKELSNKLISSMIPYKKYVHTITTDNGPEFAASFN